MPEWLRIGHGGQMCLQGRGHQFLLLLPIDNADKIVYTYTCSIRVDPNVGQFYTRNSD